MAPVASEVIALFPLGHVLMPGCPLPLRIFEPRYRQLLADVTGEGGAGHFGVVSLVSGSEVERGDEPGVEVAMIGSLAEILEVDPAPDGTSTVLTGGSRRFRIDRMVDAGTPYLQAAVTYLEEVAGVVAPGLPDAVKALASEYDRLIGVLTRTEPPPRDPYPNDDILTSYRLATDAPVDAPERQALLELPDAGTRLRRVQRVLRREVMLVRQTRTIAVSPAVLQIALRPR